MNPSRIDRPLFRTRGTAEGKRVEYIELFLDLVFVLAVTRPSHTLPEDFSRIGALHVALLTRHTGMPCTPTSAGMVGCRPRRTLRATLGSRFHPRRTGGTP
jgi:hypothetical protein